MSAALEFWQRFGWTPISYPMQQIRFCTSTDGTRIAYASSGSGPPLVWAQHWVHHLELDWASPIWRPWLSLLTRRHTVIRYDWRGCGLSDRDHVSFSHQKLVEDLEAVVAAAGVEHFALFGMAGAGSGVAMSYAVRHPKQVDRLVLYGSHIMGRWAGRPTSARVEEGEVRLKVYELGWPNETPAYGQFFTALHIPDSTSAQMRAYNDLLRQTTSPANAIGLLKTFWDIDLRAVVPQVRCPTLVLHARGDSVIPFNEGRQVAAMIPGARLFPLDSRNHLLLDHESGWRQFIDAIETFLPVSSSNSALESIDQLTAREREVLEVLAQGFDNRGIAARLKISEKTARNHLSIIFSKLGVSSRSQAIILARDAGLGHRAHN